MKKILILTFLTIMFCANLIAQKEYPSKEEGKYYKKSWRSFKRFKQISTIKILNYKSEYYTIKKSELDFNPYSPDKNRTSILNSMLERIPFQDYVMLGIEPNIEQIGNISKNQIIK